MRGMPTQESEIHIDDLHAFVYRPEKGSKGGVMLLPHNAGTDRFSREHSQLLAEAGLATLLWDPYPGKERPKTDEERRAYSAAVDDDWAWQGQSRLLSYMQEELGVERAGCIGFCMGGRLGLLLGAKDHRLASVVAFYPTIRRPKPAHQKYDVVDLAPEIRCPVTAICPGKDHIVTPEVYSDLRQALRKREEPTVAQMYPDAGHGFLHAGESPIAAKLSWPQAVAFLQACLL